MCFSQNTWEPEDGLKENAQDKIDQWQVDKVKKAERKAATAKKREEKKAERKVLTFMRSAIKLSTITNPVFRRKKLPKKRPLKPVLKNLPRSRLRRPSQLQKPRQNNRNRCFCDNVSQFLFTALFSIKQAIFRRFEEFLFAYYV